MLDLLFLPLAILVPLALGAARRGEHRLHAYLMAASLTVAMLRFSLHPRPLAARPFTLWLALLMMAGATLLMGRGALAWREGRSTRSALPRIHRTLGAATLVCAALLTLFWLLGQRT